MTTTKKADSATEAALIPSAQIQGLPHVLDAVGHVATAPAAAALSPAAARASAAQLRLLDRDHSILAFNERVFHWVGRKDVPLLERLRYLCIVSSNLDEFFEVRAEPHITAARTGETKGEHTVATFEALSAKAHDLVERQYALYNDALMPALAREGVRVVSHGERNAAQRRWVHEYFVREVRPLLVPISLDPAHPFPQVANKSLNFIVRLKGSDAFGRENEIAIVRVPRLLPRFTRLNALGALIGFAVMTGAVNFHLWTPLGIDPNNDGGGLFAAAVTIWFTSIVLIIIRRNELIGLVGDLGRAFVPSPKSQTAPARAPAHA